MHSRKSEETKARNILVLHADNDVGCKINVLSFMEKSQKTLRIRKDCFKELEILATD